MYLPYLTPQYGIDFSVDPITNPKAPITSDLRLLDAYNQDFCEFINIPNHTNFIFEDPNTSKTYYGVKVYLLKMSPSLSLGSNLDVPIPAIVCKK